MATGKGFSSKAAFKIETGDFGTAKALNGSSEHNQIPFISEGIAPAVGYDKSVVLDGNAGQKTLYATIKKYAGDIVLEAHYEGLESLLVIALGMSHQDNSPDTLGGHGVNKHYIELSDDLSTRPFNEFEMTTPSGNAIRRGTLAFEKDVSIWEFISTMINSISMQATPERVSLTLNAIANKFNQDSATNATSTNWDLPADGSQLLFSDLTVYLKPRDEFTINSANKTLILHESSSQTLTLTEAIYTGYELTQEIAKQANASSLSGSFSCEYDEQLRKFTIESDTDFYVVGTGTINSTIGFTTSNTSSSEINASPYQATPDAFAVFGSDDKVGVNSISWSLENNLDTESQDSESDLFVLEPERGGMRNISGSLEIPRYQNDEFIKSVNGFTTYQMHIQFKGNTIFSPLQEEFNIYFPQIKFTNITAPVSGADLIKQSLSFEAQSPASFYDFVNFNFGEYNFKTFEAIASSAHPLFPIVSADGLYVVTDSAVNFIQKYVDGVWTVKSAEQSGAATAATEFNGKLYIGGNGFVDVYDPTTENLTADTSSVGSVVDFAVYDGDLHIIDDAGQLFKKGASSWASVGSTGLASKQVMTSFNGNLYIIGVDSHQVYEKHYDGSTISNAVQIGNTNPSLNLIDLLVFDNKLYLNTLGYSSAELYSFDGSSWTKEGNLSTEIAYLYNYKGMLICQPYASVTSLYYWDFKTSALVNIYYQLYKTFAGKGILYKGRLIFPISSDDNMLIFDTTKEMLITVQNTNSVNPL